MPYKSTQEYVFALSRFGEKTAAMGRFEFEIFSRGYTGGMSGREQNREIEIKLRVDDAKDLVEKLKGLGAKKIERVFEQDALFDTEDEFFRKQQSILRLRICTLASGRAERGTHTRGAGKTTEGLLTFKGMVEAPARAGGRYKEREEIEFHIRDVKRFAGVLRRIGMRLWFRYEKHRTTYTSRRYPGLKLELDETPIGFFLELEGPKRQIDRAARALGYSPADYITASYLELYAAEHRRSRSNPGNMLFPRKKIAKL